MGEIRPVLTELLPLFIVDFVLHVITLLFMIFE